MSEFLKEIINYYLTTRCFNNDDNLINLEHQTGIDIEFNDFYDDRFDLEYYMRINNLDKHNDKTYYLLIVSYIHFISGKQFYGDNDSNYGFHNGIVEYGKITFLTYQFIIAAWYSKIDDVRFIIETCKNNESEMLDEDALSSLFYILCKENKTDIAQFMLDNRNSINFDSSYFYEAPIIIAAINGNLDLVKHIARVGDIVPHVMDNFLFRSICFYCEENNLFNVIRFFLQNYHYFIHKHTIQAIFTIEFIKNNNQHTRLTRLFTEYYDYLENIDLNKKSQYIYYMNLMPKHPKFENIKPYQP